MHEKWSSHRKVMWDQNGRMHLLHLCMGVYSYNVLNEDSEHTKTGRCQKPGPEHGK